MRPSRTLHKSFATKTMKFFNPRSSTVQGSSGFQCFGPGHMNQPLLYHNWSKQIGVPGMWIKTQFSNSSVAIIAQMLKSWVGEQENSVLCWTSLSWTVNTICRLSSQNDCKESFLSTQWQPSWNSWCRTWWGPYCSKFPGMQVPLSPNFIVIITVDVIQWGASEPVLLDWHWQLFDEQWWNMWWNVASI